MPSERMTAEERVEWAKVMFDPGDGDGGFAMVYPRKAVEVAEAHAAQETEALQRWKAEMIAVLEDNDAAKKETGPKLGESTGQHIRRLGAERDTLREQLQRAEERAEAADELLREARKDLQFYSDLCTYMNQGKAGEAVEKSSAIFHDAYGQRARDRVQSIDAHLAAHSPDTASGGKEQEDSADV